MKPSFPAKAGNALDLGDQLVLADTESPSAPRTAGPRLGGSGAPTPAA
ncbi:MAG: hypothetical protein MZV63_33855 [Marinilabiliales bacterium]|nr:hypothetical protein [Marinilabiliales bacterium]